MNPEKFEEKYSNYNFLDGLCLQENLFESAIGPSIIKLQKDLLEIDIEMEKTLEALNSEQLFDEEGNRSLEFCIFTNLRHIHFCQNEQLLAINEMRVIYRFKTLEIFIKSLIKSFDESVNVRAFYRWENIIKYFEEKNIILSEINAYTEADELRKVNNNLKHSDAFDDDVKKISEFKNLEYFDSNSLDAFLIRIKENIKIFQNSLIEEVRGKMFNG